MLMVAMANKRHGIIDSLIKEDNKAVNYLKM